MSELNEEVLIETLRDLLDNQRRQYNTMNYLAEYLLTGRQLKEFRTFIDDEYNEDKDLTDNEDR